MRFYIKPQLSPESHETLSVDEEGNVRVERTRRQTDKEIKEFWKPAKLVKMGKFRVLVNSDGVLIVY